MTWQIKLRLTGDIVFRRLHPPLPGLKDVEKTNPDLRIGKHCLDGVELHVALVGHKDLRETKLRELVIAAHARHAYLGVEPMLLEGLEDVDEGVLRFAARDGVGDRYSLAVVVLIARSQIAP